MQTFLPFQSFKKSAQSLDRQRLGKQRKECLQILNVLFLKENRIKAPWQNHPAALMWEGFEEALIDYGIVICQEWKARGYKDTCLDKILGYRNCFGDKSKNIEMPPWLGMIEFHLSHRICLVMKNQEYYEDQDGFEDAASLIKVGSSFDISIHPLPYFWPSQNKEKVAEFILAKKEQEEIRSRSKCQTVG